MFESISDKSRRQTVVDLFADVEPGQVVPYDFLEAALGLDRAMTQGVVNQAKSGIQREHQKSLVAVRNVGYQVIEPQSHIRLAQDHQRKGRRQTRKALMAVENTDYDKLDEADRLRFDVAVGVIKTLVQWERRADLRYASREKLDAFVAKQDSRNERTDNEVSELRDRLSRVESLLTRQKGVAPHEEI
ncbi:Uncharacterised protein [Mycobacteroides abscessus subsp. abscessus]|nr:Uncharacterised protein [Mycobacteroides abscessus subsp. abscessus]